MPEPDFLKSPMERVAELLRQAFDPDASEEARRNACEELKSFTEKSLRELAMDGDWRHILNVLDGSAADAELPGDGEWSSNEEPWAEKELQDLPLPMAQAPVLDLYTQDLRWLMRDDYRAEPLVLPSLPSAQMSPTERVALGATASPKRLMPDEALVRSLPWALVNHGATLLTMWETWPDRSELLRAFLEETIGRRAELGVPPRLAARIEDLVSESGMLQDWFDSVATDIDRFVETEILEFLPVEQIADRHLMLRLHVAHAVRLAEITNGAIIAAAELYATVRLLRAAAAKDLLRAWHEGGGDPVAAVRKYDEMNKANDCFYDRAYRGVLRQPDAASLNRLTTGERQAVALAREVRARGGRRSGFLAQGDNLI